MRDDSALTPLWVGFALLAASGLVSTAAASDAALVSAAAPPAQAASDNGAAVAQPARIESPSGQVATDLPPALDANIFGNVIVTARKRAEVAQTVPIAMTVLDQAALDKQNINSLQDLSTLVPSLFVQPSTFRQDTFNIDMRGQENLQSTDLSFDTAVAVYVDGVYYARPVGLTAALFDTESLQVLEGPQGTLVGRNATGGAILYANKEPASTFGADVRLADGNYGHTDARFTLNLPLTSTLWLRAAIDTMEANGYIKNDFYDPQTGVSNTTPGEGDRKSAGVFSLRFEPDASFHITLRGSFDVEHDTGSTYHDLGYFVGTTLASGNKPSICNIPGTCSGFTDLIGQTITPYYANYVLGTALSALPTSYNSLLKAAARAQSEGFWSTEQALNNYDTGHFQVVSGVADKTFGGLDVKLTMAYRWFDTTGDAISRGLPYVTSIYIYDTPNYRSYQSELTINGANFDNRLTWTTGLFVFKELSPDDGDQDYLFLPSAGVPAAASGKQITYTNPTSDKQENTSYAGYAQATVRISHDTRVTAGIRDTEDIRQAQLSPQTTLFPATAQTTKSVANGVYRSTPVTLLGVTYTGQTDSCSLTNAAGVLLPEAQCADNLEKTFHKPTWTVSVDHDVFTGALIYFTTRSGYRSGGINAAAASPGSFIALPESIQDFEVGIKTDLHVFGMPSRANIDAYYSDYSDIQVSETLPNVTVATTTTGGACTQAAFDAGQCLDTTKDTVTVNAKSAHIKGVEYQVSIKPIRALTLSASGSYLDAVYTNFSYAPPPGYLLPTGVANLTGTHFPLPAWQFNNTISYSLPIKSLIAIPFSDATISWHLYFQSRNEGSLVGYNAAQLAKGYSLSNFRLDLMDVGHDRLNLSGYVTNAFNKQACEAEPQGVLNSAPNATFGTPGTSGVLQCVPLPPRFYGVALAYRF